MLIDWTAAFDRYFAELEKRADQGDGDARAVLDLLVAQLGYVQDLETEPQEDTKTLKWVRQSKKHPVWRLSHPYRQGIALRTIVWFTPDGRAVVALFSNDKAAMGDVFYDSVGPRADQIIDQWLRERSGEP
ncbi:MULTISPECIES: hypothetical protein [Oerskovia]|uniref:hypothetical protein n=1 Tax=Oerskovia TaxID=162491 RepID=UPI00301A9A77